VPRHCEDGEILSASNRRHDTVVKLRHYHQAGIPHYWIIDGDERTLTVHRHTPDGYLVALRADASARVRAEPFDAFELHVAVLLGDDPDDEAAELNPPAAPGRRP
jgi:Uma2 family endonuclease